jgi:CHAD domain-containing protein
MPQMNFDLCDDQEPVSVVVSTAAADRLINFMAECTDAITERRELLREQNTQLDRIEQLEEECARINRNRDMYKDQSARQAEELHALRIAHRDLRNELSGWRGE